MIYDDDRIQEAAKFRMVQYTIFPSVTKGIKKTMASLLLSVAMVTLKQLHTIRFYGFENQIDKHKQFVSRSGVEAK